MSESYKSTRKKLYQRWWCILLIVLLPFVLLGGYGLVIATYGESKPIRVEMLRGSDAHESPADRITLISLNLAHGRGDGPNQFFVEEEAFHTNIEQVSEVLCRHRPDVVALQEADAPSWWSGGFSHPVALAKKCGFGFVAQAHNVDGLGLHYGTAMIGSLPVLPTAHSHTFARSFPTFSKGCVITTHQWPGAPEFQFDCISVHLDFANQSVRASQLAELTELIQQHQRPVILLGDFNCEADECLKEFRDENGLSTWGWERSDIVTFPVFERRLDWVFVSQEFVLAEHVVLEEEVSDHRAVKVSIERSPVREIAIPILP